MRKLFALACCALLAGCQTLGRLAVVGDSIAHREIEELNLKLGHRGPGRDIPVPWAAVIGGTIGRDGALYEAAIRDLAERGERADAAFVSLFSNDIDPLGYDPMVGEHVDTVEEQDAAIDRVMGALQEAQHAADQLAEKPFYVYWLAPNGPRLPRAKRDEMYAALRMAELRWPALRVMVLPEAFYDADGIHLSSQGELVVADLVQIFWDADRAR